MKSSAVFYLLHTECKLGISPVTVQHSTDSNMYLLFPVLAGEMSHHDILDAASQGINVILCEHSNTERGFLSDLRDMLGAHLEKKINIILSETDRDPLHVV